MKARRATVIAGVVLAATAAVAVFLGSGHFISQAVQNPTMSLDMVTSGNAYDDNLNQMTLGQVDNCLTSATANPATHNHPAHLVVQNVEDLVAFQVRLNYVGDKMRPSVWNPTPFADTVNGGNVGFLNLPLDAGVHRVVTPAQAIPAAPADGTNTAQTALVGANYQGVQTFPVSPDTPAKPAPDDSSYSAPNGGVLATLTLQVVGDESGNQLFMNLDDASPNAPGSRAVVFTGSGTTDVNMLPSQMGDGFHGEGAACVPLDCVNADCPVVVPTAAPTPTLTASPRPTPEPGQPWVLTSNDPQEGGQFGRAIATGDVDGDGISEIAIGAPLENEGTLIDQGRVYIFSGVTGQLLRPLDSPNPSQSGQFGKTLAMGDLNADGRAEVVVEGNGRVYVFAGDTGVLTQTIFPPGGFGSFFGDAIAINDVDGDGSSDLVVGAWNTTVGGQI